MGRRAPELTATVVVAIMVLGVFGTGIAYVINYALITTEGPTAASVVTYLVPAVSVALGATFLSEPTGPNLVGSPVDSARCRPCSAPTLNGGR